MQNGLMQHPLVAEQIAHALPGCRKVSGSSWRACCPAHDDESPSLNITERNGKVLLKCWSGCGQSEVIDALRRLHLWPDAKRQPAKVHTLTDKREMRAFVAAHEYNLKRNIPTSTKHKQLYGQYQRVLCSPFTPGEVVESHLWCLQYSAAVRRGEVPGPEADSRFLRISRIVRDKVIPYEF